MPSVAELQLQTPRPPSSPHTQPSTLYLPRILCLHGGGTNARIFRAQCRVLTTHFAPHFRLVFADAPFPSLAGPDVKLVYADPRWGRFRSWLPEGAGVDCIVDREAVVIIDASVERAMKEDDKLGAKGNWIGLLGFSQGAKMAASMLLRQQMNPGRRDPWRFAVLLAGRAPLVSLDVDTDVDLLDLPTLHVHGLRDAGLPLHRDLLYTWCDAEKARLLEWDGDHRVPIKSRDVAAVVAEVMALVGELD